MVKILFRLKTPPAEVELLSHAATALQECLDSISGAIVVVTRDVQNTLGMKPDFVAEVTLAGRHTTLVAELKRSGEPQFARTSISQIETYRRIPSLAKAIGVFIAPFISEATMKLCRDEGVGYLDLAGNCHLAFRGVYIHVEGKPNPFARSRSLVSLYQPKAERILRVLLTAPARSWRLQALADEAGVSVGQTFKVKELLLEREWLKESEHGISLTKPSELLSDWAEHYRFSKHQSAHFYTLSDLADFERTFSFGCRQRNIPCAFTSFAAAARYAPYATYKRATAYVHHELAEVVEMLSLPPLQLSPVETGANVILLSPYDDGVFYGTRHQRDITIASPLQTYIDLQTTGGRGREAAEYLLEKEIVPNW